MSRNRSEKGFEDNLEIGAFVTSALQQRGLSSEQITMLLSQHGKTLIDKWTEESVRLSKIRRSSFPVEACYDGDRVELIERCGLTPKDRNITFEDNFSCWGSTCDMYKFRGQQEICIDVFETDTHLDVPQIWNMHWELNLRPATLPEFCALLGKYPNELLYGCIVTFGTYLLPTVFASDIPPFPLIAGIPVERLEQKILQWVSTEGGFEAGSRIAGVKGFISPEMNPFLTRFHKKDSTKAS